uniref:Uncharacterized protein n=1 Tax=Anguilla anguilla TaxID=7936 RepID=A0A0E9UGL9_ANGAN
MAWVLHNHANHMRLGKRALVPSHQLKGTYFCYLFGYWVQS